MKECPICHELNEDNQDTCKKCHASLDFKIYRADEKELNMKECPKCKASNSDNAYSCYKRGSSLNDTQNKEQHKSSSKNNCEYICKHCGATTPYKERLCVKCQTKRTLVTIVCSILFILVYGIITFLFGIYPHPYISVIIIAVLILISFFISHTIFESHKIQ